MDAHFESFRHTTIALGSRGSSLIDNRRTVGGVAAITPFPMG
jgi:hypothetical protein